MRYRVGWLSILIFLLALPSSAAAELPELLGVLQDTVGGTFFGDRIVPLGDQNDDGYDDFLISDVRRGIHVYYGSDSVDGSAGVSFDSVSYPSNVGDVNWDGYDDLCGFGWTPYNLRLGLYYGGPAFDTIRDCWFGVDTLIPIVNTVGGNDINVNGTNEIISVDGGNDFAVLCELTADNDSVPDLVFGPLGLSKGEYATFGFGLISGDFNGDDTTDLAICLRRRYNQDASGSVCLYWGGVEFDTIPDMVIHRPGGYILGAEDFGEKLVYLGDFNADGYDDFYAGVGVGYDTLNFIFFGGPDIDTVPDITLWRRHSIANLAGDVNDDGHNDLIISYPLPWSAMGHVSILFGGPDCDSIPDVVIGNGDMPAYQTEFGMHCSGIGDYNGDGVDDFAFSAIESGRATVYLFSGESIATSVQDRDPDLLPHTIDLRQNYPNPFNPSTTIEFHIPSRNRVRVEVFNILGQHIVALVDGELPAGSHRVNWDGHDTKGDLVSSGVYLYRVTAGTSSQVRKMVLIR